MGRVCVYMPVLASAFNSHCDPETYTLVSKTLTPKTSEVSTLQV